ncbi:MAG: VOC family protein [Chloroflexota bacterium]
MEDVQASLKEVVSAGGASLGAIVTRTIEGVGVLTFCYCTDPEGNIIELQHWSGHSASPWEVDEGLHLTCVPPTHGIIAAAWS